MSTYAERLKIAMERAGVKTGPLAKALGVTYQAVRKVENGTSNAFDAANNSRAARFLRISPDWLADEFGPMLIHSDDLGNSDSVISNSVKSTNSEQDEERATFALSALEVRLIGAFRRLAEEAQHELMIDIEARAHIPTAGNDVIRTLVAEAIKPRKKGAVVEPISRGKGRGHR